MIIYRLEINNYKSIINVELKYPNRFLAFVGANSVGKSNIFEALEFAKIILTSKDNALSLFGGIKEISSRNSQKAFRFVLESISDSSLIDSIEIEYYDTPKGASFGTKGQNFEKFSVFIKNFSRIFIGHPEYVKLPFKDAKALSLDCSNLEKVLGRLLKDNALREEILDWLLTLIPEFRDIEIRQNELTGEETLLVYEKNDGEPFSGKLISDGTKNILSLLSVVLQQDEPQFICIEEPENGLNPKVIKEIVNFFREKCKEKGHYIWLTTHSQTLVSSLNQDEIIIVDKVNGETQAKNIDEINLHGLKLDEAWLSNILGGIPW
ncbi:MAG: hypothetical protein AUJ54_09820 [Ignavibacteria bacterium CG1_02_37_35]|nr:MAG: hypothetical protein AUJ54_09820 [Ignavibacteria bacterium CG1_02_37_35]PIX94936.1 MAG: chromosome segregation protein SMC [Ignavibacteria bacterium CG_4_10_14_3_um_filter_37_18]